ncbi:M23 family metallopeptidase [Microbacterium protaetiae]|uniref:M23 family metallopeptidase n=1 Tax=Microbacterium protaetiae TaxID=2509458 RepID=A0A4V0YDL8_9MICO|nr:M23 family metallopeptidase [Microbacterium protaetiae]QAY61161.1 M23 family metallopeptidase [Microbacterium protaetiae]
MSTRAAQFPVALRRITIVASAVILLALAVVLGGAPAAAHAHAADTALPQLVRSAWEWPLQGFRIAAPYRAPAHEYGPGHRGIDLEPTGAGEVHAPRAGVIAFAGRIADRGILTIDHQDGYVTTLEPIDSAFTAGDRVEQGEVIGTIAHGGHAAPGTVHFGVRLNGEYINPMLLFGDVPRAVLLPCCS